MVTCSKPGLTVDWHYDWWMHEEADRTRSRGWCVLLCGLGNWVHEEQLCWLVCWLSDPFSFTVLHPALLPGRLTFLESTTWAHLLSCFHVAQPLGGTSRGLEGIGERSLILPSLAVILTVFSGAVPLPQVLLSACFLLFPQAHPSRS